MGKSILKLFVCTLLCLAPQITASQNYENQIREAVNQYNTAIDISNRAQKTISWNRHSQVFSIKEAEEGKAELVRALAAIQTKYAEISRARNLAIDAEHTLSRIGSIFLNGTSRGTQVNGYANDAFDFIKSCAREQNGLTTKMQEVEEDISRLDDYIRVNRALERPAAVIFLNREETIQIRQLKDIVDTFKNSSFKQLPPDITDIVLDTLINGSLFIQYCEKEGLSVNDFEIDLYVSNMKLNTVGPNGSEDAFKKILFENGVIVAPETYAKSMLLFGKLCQRDGISDKDTYETKIMKSIYAKATIKKYPENVTW